MSEHDEAVVVECDLDASPDKVWRALTEPELVDAWLGPDEAGVEIGEIHETAPGRELTYGWRDIDGGRHSLVTFTLSETEDGSHLRIVHEPVAARLGLCGLPRRPAQARACMSRRPAPTCMCKAA
jgi:uncharacterized protein YndB with AHSA1/START domain